MKREFSCTQCGKAGILRDPSHSRLAVYCSKECVAAGKRRPPAQQINFDCAGCGERATRAAHLFKHLSRKGRPQYCSHSCAMVSRRIYKTDEARNAAIKAGQKADGARYRRRKALEAGRELKPNEMHGGHHLPEYKVWVAMKQRCENPKNLGYANYGGRGITVCEQWSKSFASFLQDMGRRPSAELSVERIDNDLGYEPNNCRWATRAEQNNNRRAARRATLQMVKVLADALISARNALECSIDTRGLDPAGVMLSALNQADAAISAFEDASARWDALPVYVEMAEVAA